MKAYLMSEVFIFLYLASIAQYSVKGKIVDGNNNPLQFVTVYFKQGSIILKSINSDSNGRYTFSDIKTGKYSVATYFGTYQNKEIFFDLKLDTIIDLKLAQITSLKEVVVINSRRLIERRNDRIIFNVENSLTAIGSDVVDALQKTPNVLLMNNKISLVGKSGVSVMINDRLIHLNGEELINYLRSISSDNISKIEVITNPPAKYEAQGNNGLINIILKRNEKEGHHVFLRWGYTQSTYPLLFGGATFNYNKGKSKFYGSLDIRDGSNAQIEQSNTYYPVQRWEQTNIKRGYTKSLNTKFVWDYEVSKKTSIGIAYSYTKTKYDLKPNILTSVFNKINIIDSLLLTTAHTQIPSYSSAINLHIGHLFDTTGKKLTIDVDWFKYINMNERDFSNINYYSDGIEIPNSSSTFLSKNEQDIDLVTINSVFEIPYKTFNITFGGKLTFIKDNSLVTFFKLLNGQQQFDSLKSNQFFYNENTQAIFGSFNRTFKKMSYQIGLRGEYTQNVGLSTNDNSITNNDYIRLFPTIYITYTPTKKNLVSINYGRRINRPNYALLNPFKYYYSPYTYGEGNPFLQPSFNHNIELSHTYKNIITTSFSFSYEINKYNYITFVESNLNTQITRPLNFLVGYNYLLSNSILFNKVRWLESNNQMQLFYTVSKSSLSETQQKVKGWSAYISSDNQIAFNTAKTLIGGINLTYSFPQIDGIYKIGSFYSLDFGLRIFLIKKKLQTSINVVDLLKTNKFSSSSIINNIKINNFSYYDNRQLRISIRYSLGNDKIKLQERKIANQEERRRVGN